MHNLATSRSRGCRPSRSSTLAIGVALAAAGCRSGEPQPAESQPANAPSALAVEEGPVALARTSLTDQGTDTLACHPTPNTCKNNSHPTITADGTRVAWDSDAFNVMADIPSTANLDQVYWIDVAGGDVHIASAVSINGQLVPGNAASGFCEISGDGRFIAFPSFASNLVPNDGNKKGDVFLASTQLQEVVRVSENAGGGDFDNASDDPVITHDGRLVAFTSTATNMSPLYRAGGKKVATLVPNSTGNVFVKDLDTARFEWISLSQSQTMPNGASSQPSISADGERVSFTSDATNLLATDANGSVSDVYFCDRNSANLDCVSRNWSGAQGGNGVSHKAAISGDGRFVCFESAAFDLLPPGVDTNGKIDIFVRDLDRKQTVRVSISTAGEQAVDNSGYSAMSFDGRFVAFTSTAQNLVTVPPARGYQFFIRDRDVSGTGRFDQPGNVATRRMSQTPAGVVGAGKNGGNCDVSADGRFTVFMSEASNLIPSDINGIDNMFQCSPSCPFGRDVFRAQVY
jgi:Tol biopolymer transport system component